MARAAPAATVRLVVEFTSSDNGHQCIVEGSMSVTTSGN
jgi:hypothetical protein